MSHVVSAQSASARHPFVIAAAAALRFVATLLASAIVVALIAWLVAAAAMLPLSTVLSWAFAGIAAAFGFEMRFGPAQLGLPPTALSALVWWLLWRAAARIRREFATEESAGGEPAAERNRLRAEFAAAGCLGAVTAVLLVLTVVFNPLIVPTTVGSVRALVLIVSAVALGTSPLPRLLHSVLHSRWGDAGTEALTEGLHLARRVAVSLLVLAQLVLLAGIIANWSHVLALLHSYSATGAAAVGLGILQTAYAPTIWAAALSWVSGSGVELSAAAHASVLTGSDLPRPPVPVLAIIPAHPAPWLAGAVVLPVVAASICVIGRARWLRGTSWAAVAVATAAIALGLACASVFFSGAVGPGGLGIFGVRPWPFTAVLAGLCCLGMAGGRAMGALRDRYEEPA